MALRKVRLEDDPILRKISKDVPQITKKIKILVEDMLDTMNELNGCGLAAPQIGILRKIIVVKETEESDEIVVINPEITEASGEESLSEACLSIPSLMGYVTRPTKITVTGLDLNGNDIKIEATDRLARIFCHEIDHLHGILYVDKASDVFDPTDE